MKIESYDRRIKYYPLLMERSLEEIPDYTLPDGFSFSFYDASSRDAWIDIEMSAGECVSREEGLRYWNEYFEPRKDELSRRMVFVENSVGEKIATGTMLYDIKTGDDGREAWLHWVAVRKDFQGRGLSRPLISYLLSLMRISGYNSVKLSTHTWANLACRLYMDMGFRPCEKSLVDFTDGWGIIKALTGHPCLKDVRPLPDSFNIFNGSAG